MNEITGVALYHPDEERIIISMCKPFRHNHLYSALFAMKDDDLIENGIEYPRHNRLVQGFIIDGRFYNRKEAFIVAEATGQLREGAPSRPKILLSEDLW